MLLTEYNEKKHMKAIRKEGYEDGLEEDLETITDILKKIENK